MSCSLGDPTPESYHFEVLGVMWAPQRQPSSGDRRFRHVLMGVMSTETFRESVGD
jgi:hypothetical protein